MRWLWWRLPGPLAARVAIAVVLGIAALVILHFTYEWMGANLLDNGGSIG